MALQDIFKVYIRMSLIILFTKEISMAMLKTLAKHMVLLLVIGLLAPLHGACWRGLARQHVTGFSEEAGVAANGGAGGGASESVAADEDTKMCYICYGSTVSADDPIISAFPCHAFHTFHASCLATRFNQKLSEGPKKFPACPVCNIKYVGAAHPALLSRILPALNAFLVEGLCTFRDVKVCQAVQMGAGMKYWHSAANAGDHLLLKRLIDAGIDIEAKDSNDFTALHLAGIEGHSLAVQCLISAGADINATAGHGMTALHLATYQGHFALAEWLVLYGGANIDAKTKIGDTALSLATTRGHTRVADLLRVDE